MSFGTLAVANASTVNRLGTIIQPAGTKQFSLSDETCETCCYLKSFTVVIINTVKREGV